MRCRQTVLWIALIAVESLSTSLAFCADTGARCRVSESEYRGYASLVLENDLVKVSLVPAFGGRVTEYALKPEGTNQLLPFQGEKKETMPGVVKTTTNNGGIEDRFWGLAVPNAISPYQVKIVENGPAQAAVLLTWENATLKIERTVSPAAAGVELKMEIRVTNKSTQAVNWRYWPAAMVQAGGDFTPRGPDWMYGAIRVTGKSDMVRKAQIVPGHLFPWETPAQGWIAVLDRNRKIGFGFNAPEEELLPDGFHYVWCGETYADPGLAWPPNEESRSRNVLLQEIYAARSVAPGAAQVYHLSVIGFAGLADLDYLSSRLALDLDVPDQAATAAKGKLPVSGTVVLLSEVADGQLKLILVDKDGKEGCAVSFPIAEASAGTKTDGLQAAATPLKPVAFQGMFPAENVTPGIYTLKGILEQSNGNKVEEFNLPMPGIEVK